MQGHVCKLTHCPSFYRELQREFTIDASTKTVLAAVQAIAAEANPTVPPVGVTAPLVKPGWQTTEFWISAAMALPGIAVMAGFVPASDEPNLETLLTKIIAGVIASVAAYKYVSARTTLKKG